MNTLGPTLQRTEDIEAILRTLPMWFGIERALQMYVRDSATMPTFAIESDAKLVAFLTLREHFEEAWEVHCMAVAAEFRSHGLGTRLLVHSEAWLRRKGVRFLQVKTVAATGKSEAYAETRKFCAAKGFTPLEIFPELWDPWNPALQCIKLLNAANPALNFAGDVPELVESVS